MTSHLSRITERSSPERGEDGFTLIELLVALAIASVLIASVYAAFFAVFRSADAGTSGLDERIEAGRLLDRFSRDVHSVYFAPGDAGARFLGREKGMGSSVRFTTFAHPAVRRGAPAIDIAGVAYTAEESGEGFLVRREVWNPFVGVKTGAVVMDGLGSFDLEYFNGRDWIGAWDSELEGGPPAAVRLTVELSGGQRLSTVARVMTR